MELGDIPSFVATAAPLLRRGWGLYGRIPRRNWTLRRSYAKFGHLTYEDVSGSALVVDTGMHQMSGKGSGHCLLLDNAAKTEQTVNEIDRYITDPDRRRIEIGELKIKTTDAQARELVSRSTTRVTDIVSLLWRVALDVLEER